MMQESPRVSAIVPAYNAAEYLEDCLNSILRQSLKELEVIVIDDGSTDSTLRIAEKIAAEDKRIRVESISNRGVSAARNLGIDLAKGEYLTFVDADDILHPMALQTMLDVCRGRRVPVCISGFRKFSGKAPKTMKTIPADFISKAHVWTYREAMEIALYQKELLNSPWGALIESRLLKEGTRFREGTRYEDLDAFYRFYESTQRIAYLPLPLYFYRDNLESFIRTWSPERLDVLDVTDRMLAFFSIRYPELKAAAADRRFSAHFNMWLLMKRNGIDNPEALKRCADAIRAGRKQALTDTKVRLKNKIGALLSYFLISRN